jgi:hypothetical protein
MSFLNECMFGWVKLPMTKVRTLYSSSKFVSPFCHVLESSLGAYVPINGGKVLPKVVASLIGSKVNLSST